MNLRCLDVEQLIMLHVYVLTNTTGSDGIRDIGRLEAVVATQTQEVFGREIYVSVHDKAGALMRGIVADHAFVDGNKRTAVLVGLTFLSINGVVCTASPQELEDFAVQIAVKHLSVEQIATWLQAHSAQKK